MRGPSLGLLNSKPIRLKTFLDFLEALIMCLKQGLSLMEAIDLIKTLNIIRKEPLDRFKAQLQEHAHLSQALNTLLAKSLRMPSFSKKNLPESKRFLEDVYAFYKQYHHAKKQLVAALTYPVCLWFFSVLLSVFLILLLMPMLQSVFNVSLQMMMLFRVLIIGVSSLMCVLMLGSFFYILHYMLRWQAKDYLFWQLALYRPQGIYLRDILEGIDSNHKGSKQAAKQAVLEIRSLRSVEEALKDAFSIVGYEYALLKKALYKGGSDAFDYLLEFRRAHKKRISMILLQWLKPALLLLFCVKVMLFIALMYYPVVISLDKIK